MEVRHFTPTGEPGGYACVTRGESGPANLSRRDCRPTLRVSGYRPGPIAGFRPALNLPRSAPVWPRKIARSRHDHSDGRLASCVGYYAGTAPPWIFVFYPPGRLTPRRDFRWDPLLLRKALTTAITLRLFTRSRSLFLFFSAIIPLRAKAFVSYTRRRNRLRRQGCCRGRGL